MRTNEELIAEARKRIAPARKRLDSGQWMENIGLLLVAEDLGDALEALLPKEVQTVEELDGLPHGSVILSEVGGVFQRWMHPEEAWYEPGMRTPMKSAGISIPARVLFTPPQNGEER